MFMLANTLPRPDRDVYHVDLATLTVRPDDFEGYAEWSAALSLGPEQEPAPDAPTARYLEPDAFAALISGDEPAPEPEATPARYIKKYEAPVGPDSVEARESDRRPEHRRVHPNVHR